MPEGKNWVIWTVKDVAELFDVTHSIVRKWISQGSLSGSKEEGRWVILESNVEALFNRMAG